MNTGEIQARLNALAARMVAKGLRAPEVGYQLRSESEPQVILTYGKLKNATSDWDRDFAFFDGDAALDKAQAFVAGLPDAEQRRRADFMEQLSKTIDLGRQNGIDVDYVNPLIEAMKRLSENALTHQPGGDA